MTDYSILQKYKNASAYKYCGEINCTDTASKHNCVWYKSDRESDLKPCPAGYKFDAWDDGSMCDPNYWGRRCIKDSTGEHWEGEYATKAKSSNPTKTTMENAFKCCSNGFAATTGNVEKCGSLYSGTDNTFTPECNRLFKRYCLKGDNINTDLCKKKIMDYPEFRAQLADICPGKIGSAEWEDTCACYYGFNHYDEIARQIESRWTGPENGIPRTPQCVNPRCRTSPYRNTADDDICGTVSFTQCVNEISLDLTGSKIRDIEFNQNSECNNLYKKTDNSPVGADGANNSASKKNMTVIIFTLACIILAVLTGGAYMFYHHKTNALNAVDGAESNTAFGGTFIPLHRM